MLGYQILQEMWYPDSKILQEMWHPESKKLQEMWTPEEKKNCRKCGYPPIFKHCGQEILLPNMFFLLSIGSSFQHSLLMSLQVTFQLEKVMEEVLRQDQCPEGRGRLASHFIHAFGELVQQLETVVPIQSKKGHTDVPEQKQSKIIVQGVPTSLGYAKCNVLKLKSLRAKRATFTKLNKMPKRFL